MKFANHAGRLILMASDAPVDLSDAHAIDVHRASGGQLPSAPEQALERWDDVLAWSATTTAPADVAIDPAQLGPPSPRPQQIFGIGINYSDHGEESGMPQPEVPLVFTKLGPSLTGPFTTVELSSESVDWEVELVVIIGKFSRDVAAEHAWSHVAGVTCGQDLSDREIQWRPQATPQFSLGKSLPGFAPIGPLLVTVDELSDPNDLELSCHLNDEEVQRSRTSRMIFSVGQLISYLSAITPLHPGDLLFTGTPSGIGMTRNPPRYLQPHDRLHSHLEGVGSMSTILRPARMRETA